MPWRLSGAKLDEAIRLADLLLDPIHGHAPKVRVRVGVSSERHEPRREHLVDLVPVQGSVPRVKQITGLDVAAGQIQGEGEIRCSRRSGKPFS